LGEHFVHFCEVRPILLGSLTLGFLCLILGTFPFIALGLIMKRRPTIIDVAERAGVSKSTVSRVIADDGKWVSEETKERILQAIDELDYIRDGIASSMRTARTHTIMLAIPDITNPFWPAVARGAQDIMDVEGYAVIFANCDWNKDRESDFLEMAQRNRIDGILINPVEVSDQNLQKLNIPIVLLGIHQGYHFDMVGTDSREGAVDALMHLIALGHRRIGLILGERQGSRVSRLPLYMEVLNNAGISLDSNLIVTVPFNQNGAHEGMKSILTAEKMPTAVFCENDILAIGAMQVIHSAGLSIPEDISIIGMDNIFAASITMPPLTTIAKPKYEIGSQAAKLLLKRINGESLSAPQKIVIPCQLLLRGSLAQHDG
jgi:LacI family transcriptional regulator